MSVVPEMPTPEDMQSVSAIQESAKFAVFAGAAGLIGGVEVSLIRDGLALGAAIGIYAVPTTVVLTSLAHVSWKKITSIRPFSNSSRPER
jgi:hypothetical protein